LDAEEFARTGPGSLALGWELALLALAAHTDGWHATCLVPVPSPGPDWLHGPEGGTYVRAWAVRWAAEAVAAGVDEATARQGESDLVREEHGRAHEIRDEAVRDRVDPQRQQQSSDHVRHDGREG